MVTKKREEPSNEKMTYYLLILALYSKLYNHGVFFKKYNVFLNVLPMFGGFHNK